MNQLDEMGSCQQPTFAGIYMKMAECSFMDNTEYFGGIGDTIYVFADMPNDDHVPIRVDDLVNENAKHRNTVA